ncbi:MAG: hypothetical protein U9Q81_19875 [Pseudomonadota bacterium]|nr:hypothetical protein [Pseudomonadota bacterium]
MAPTIADLAEVTPWLPVDGRSLLPLLSPGSVPWRKRFLIEHPPVGSPFGVPPYLAVRQTRLSDQRAAVYAETLSGDGVLTDAELYDLTTDPYQLESLHADPSWRRVRLILRTHLEALKECGLGTCQILEDRNGW